MFYLETKDGDKFFTDPKSDDKLEFEKIIEDKLGKQSAELFNSLLDEAKDSGYDEGYDEGYENGKEGNNY